MPRFTFNINGNSETAEGFDAEREWARSYWSALEPHHIGVYVNFLMEEGQIGSGRRTVPVRTSG